MGLFTDHKQEQLDNAALKVYNDMMSFTKALDESNGQISIKATLQADKVQESIIDFYASCERHKSTHSFVQWAGQRTLLTGVIMAITEVVNDIQQGSQYKFIKLFNWLNEKHI